MQKTLREIIDTLTENEPEEFPEDMTIFKFDNDLVELYTPIIKFGDERHTFYAAEGVYCIPDEEGGYMPDWSLTWIWSDLENPDEHVYFEQDPIETALHNFGHVASERMDIHIWSMPAEIIDCFKER